MGWTGAYAELVRRRPSGSLVTAANIASLLIHVSLVIFVQSVSFALLQDQPWLVHAKRNNTVVIINNTVVIINNIVVIINNTVVIINNIVVMIKRQFTMRGNTARVSTRSPGTVYSYEVSSGSGCSETRRSARHS